MKPVEQSQPTEKFLTATEIIDWNHPAVLVLAQKLANELNDPIEIAERCFTWVRDEVKHCIDHGLNEPVTCSASEVLAARNGLCYAKSHLLAALLRANSIPAGFCYQRFATDRSESGFGLHGLNAIYLSAVGWYRADARGNRQNVDARFTPPVEKLPFAPKAKGEQDVPGIFPAPLPQIVAVLKSCKTYDEVLRAPRDLDDAISNTK